MTEQVLRNNGKQEMEGSCLSLLQPYKSNSTQSNTGIRKQNFLNGILYCQEFCSIAQEAYNRNAGQDCQSNPFFFFFFLFFVFLNLFIYLFIYLWLCWVFVSVRGLSLVAASGSHSSSRCAGLSLSRSLLLRSTGSRSAGSVIVAHGSSCSATCGILPDQGSNPCPLHWQADSQPLRHQGSPMVDIFILLFHYLLGSVLCYSLC